MVKLEAAPTLGSAPLPVTFSNLSTPTQIITGAAWHYGDGVISNTLAMTHTHIYTQAGVYSVTLSVGDGVITDTLTRTNYITVTGETAYTSTTRVITYDYDHLYRLTDADYSTGEQFEYAYDAVGNRAVQTRTLTATSVITYHYDYANRLDYFYTDGVPTELDWDANGNLLMQGTSVYTWDAANRLASANVDGVASTFAYNGLGQRTEQTVEGLTTEYVLDVADGLPEVILATTGGAGTYYVQIQGQVLAQQETGAWGYVLPDHLGSVRQIIDPDGQVSLAQNYDPFGVPLEAAGAGASEFGYTGEWYESYTNLLFLRARHYDPAIGRFLSKDPWPGVPSRPISLQSYLYASANPVTYVDPSGLYDCSAWPSELRFMCRLLDSSSAARLATYKTMQIAFLAMEFTDAAFFLRHYMAGNGETVYFGSRLVEMIETDAAPFMKEWRTEYLSYAAHQMRGKAGGLPMLDRRSFLSNAPGIPESYAARVYPISEKTYIATGGFWLNRLYSGTVEERSEGRYHISLMTEFDVNKPYNFDVKNVEQYPPDTDYEDIPLNPPAPFRIPYTNWTVYFPDEWGKALEDEGYAVRFDAKGEWARKELLIAVDRNCDGWDLGDIESGPIIIKAWLPIGVNPSLSKSNVWVWFG